MSCINLKVWFAHWRENFQIREAAEHLKTQIRIADLVGNCRLRVLTFWAKKIMGFNISGNVEFDFNILGIVDFGF